MNSIAIYCGSAVGNQPIYAAQAAALGRELARRGLTLVYGGGHAGLMGAVADAALAAGGRVVGVIPEFMMAREWGHQGCTELHVVETMHERKQLMADLADGYLALPGGFGTLEELFEVLTWGQLELHAKPVGLLNVAGFYDPLLTLIEHLRTEGFLHLAGERRVVAAAEPAALLDLL